MLFDVVVAAAADRCRAAAALCFASVLCVRLLRSQVCVCVFVSLCVRTSVFVFVCVCVFVFVFA